ncbi:MAG: ribosomal protein S19 family protein [Nanoarchaeota archaeon]|nr:ribosomal protein S19 family protein [Nanoarchaeota archaeon]
MAEDKIYKYKGNTLEELKAMPIEKLALLFPSSLRRKINRGFSEQEEKLLSKIRKGEKNIKTHARDMIVLPEMVGLKLGVYNGKEFVEVNIVQEMIALRLGELAPTRKIASHTTLNDKK